MTSLSRERAVGNPSPIMGQTAKMNSRTGTQLVVNTGGGYLPSREALVTNAGKFQLIMNFLLAL